MNLQNTLSKKVKQAISQLYNTSLETVEFQATRKDFEGDVTMVVFPLVKQLIESTQTYNDHVEYENQTYEVSNFKSDN